MKLSFTKERVYRKRNQQHLKDAMQNEPNHVSKQRTRIAKLCMCVKCIVDQIDSLRILLTAHVSSTSAADLATDSGAEMTWGSGLSPIEVFRLL